MLIPKVRVKAAFDNGTEIDRVMPSDEADAYLRTLATDKTCSHFEARGLWNQDRKAYDEC